jgi:hypothetical protein
MISPTGRIPSKAGYTLIELILLTVIIAILVAVSTPLFRNTFTSLELKESSYNIAKLVNYIQERAIVEGVPYKLVLDAERSRYYIMKSDPKDPAKYMRLEEKTGRIFGLPAGAKLKTDKAEIHFYPDGHSDKATLTIISKGRTERLMIKGNLGNVEFADKEDEKEQ